LPFFCLLFALFTLGVAIKTQQVFPPQRKTEVIKVTLSIEVGREGTASIAKKLDSPSKEGWVTVATRKQRQSISSGGYDPATRKTVSWNVTAAEVDVEPEKEAQVVHDARYYDIFNIVDLDEITLLAIHHKQLTEFANVSAGIGGRFDNTTEY
jgi:hypothetical protein